MPDTREGQKKASDALGTEVTVSFEPLCGLLGLQPNPREKQSGLLTAETAPALVGCVFGQTSLT